MFGSGGFCVSALICTSLATGGLQAQAPAQTPSASSSSSSAKHVKKPAGPIPSELEAGAVSNGVYRNKTLGLSCKIRDGWVLRTEEMNARAEGKEGSDSAPTSATSSSNAGGRVLLAAFSRPPEAKAKDVNASVLIAAERVEAYPGMTDPAQYFGPLTEVAKAQGFVVDEEPYEYEVGTKKLVRGDFQKDVGTRRMLQSSLALVAHGYIVSITVIGGTDDEVEELIDGLSFGAIGK